MNVLKDHPDAITYVLCLLIAALTVGPHTRGPIESVVSSVTFALGLNVCLNVFKRLMLLFKHFYMQRKARKVKK